LLALCPLGVSAIVLLVGPLIITIIDLHLCRSIICRSRSYHGFNLGGCLLLCLIVVIRVIEDDYLAVTRRTEDVTVEIAKKLSAISSSREVSVMNEEGSSIRLFPVVLPCSNTSEQGQHDEATDGDPGGSGDPDGAGGEVSASPGKGLPSAEGEHSRLVPLLSSIGG
jgi:hypothetical protein